MAQAKQDKPDIGLNLDSLEREDKPEPFRFTLGGKVWTAIDPMDLDWQELSEMNVNDVRQTLRALLGDEKFAEFEKIKLPAWKTQKLSDACAEHYGLMNLGEDGAS